MKLLKELREDDVFGKVISSNEEYRIRNAARAIAFNDDGNIAIMHSRNIKFHKLPGGGVEDGEDILSALDREIEEEVGAGIEIGKEIGKIIEYKNESGIKQISYCYFAKIVGELREQSLTEYEAVDHNFELIWVSLDEAIELLEGDNPDDYTGNFIVKRDLIFLKEAKKIS